VAQPVKTRPSAAARDSITTVGVCDFECGDMGAFWPGR
jgi:hypothetical protein